MLLEAYINRQGVSVMFVLLIGVIFWGLIIGAIVLPIVYVTMKALFAVIGAFSGVFVGIYNVLVPKRTHRVRV